MSVQFYIHLCLKFCEQSHSEKHIDIIVPIDLITFKDTFSLQYSNFSEVAFVTLEEGKVHYETLYKDANPDSGKKPKLRVINLFRFNNPTFTKLIAASHPFKLCTGDQSFSDVISVRNGIPFYQIMDWKDKLYDNFIAIATIALQSVGIDLEDSLALKYLKLISSPNFDPNKLNADLDKKIY